MPLVTLKHEVEVTDLRTTGRVPLEYAVGKDAVKSILVNMQDRYAVIDFDDGQKKLYLMLGDDLVFGTFDANTKTTPKKSPKA